MNAIRTGTDLEKAREHLKVFKGKDVIRLIRECVYVHTECARMQCDLLQGVRGCISSSLLSSVSLSAGSGTLGWMVFGQSLTIFHPGMCIAPVRLPTTETE